MAGTGKKGYTGPALYGGSYDIQNGLITSGAGATNSGIANRNGAVTTNTVGSSAGSGSLPDAVFYASPASEAASYGLSEALTGIGDQLGSYLNSLESTIKTSNSDYADMVRQILDNQNANTAKSQDFAREQMAYQRESDASAMAWSANEAQKNRDWQERLSNTAHQREVQDLIAAGLNPVLSANQGAFTGSGATGQGFSSSGAMGSVDNSGTAAMAGLFNTVMNTASQAAIANIYTQAERYSADQNYAAAKLGAEASIYNNNNSVSAQKAINQMNNEYDIQKANISAAASNYMAEHNLAAAQASAGGMIGAANINSEASRYVADTNKAASDYRARGSYAETKYQVDHSGPIGQANAGAEAFKDWTGLDPREFTKKLVNNIMNPDTSSYGSSGRGRNSNSQMLNYWQ